METQSTNNTTSLNNIPAALQGRLLSRLKCDLQELFSDPYPGIAISHHSDVDLRHFCLLLSPDSGPYEGFRLHFKVTLPDHWPEQPPMIESDSYICHPNIYDNWICCDLLNKNNPHRNIGYSGGYTPAFTLRGLFIQFLSFFTSRYVDQEDYEGKIDLTKYEQRFHYTTLPHFKKLVPKPDLQLIEDAIEKFEIGDASQQGSLKRDFHRQVGKGKLVVKEEGGFRVRSWDGRHDTIEVAYDWNQYRRETWRGIRNFKCSNCGYGIGGRTPPVVSPGSAAVLKFKIGKDICQPNLQNLEKPRYLQETPILASPKIYQSQKRCHLHMIPPEVLLYLASKYLPSESIISFGKAYPRFRTIYQENHILLLRELRCFWLRVPLHHEKSILGIGVHLGYVNPTNPASPVILESTFDYLSAEAFEHFRVRESVTGRKVFEFFLPLAFSKQHFAKIVAEPRPVEGSHKTNLMPILWTYLRRLALAISGSKCFDEAKSVEDKMILCLDPLWKICNGMVVGLMQEVNDVTSSPFPSHTLLALATTLNEEKKTLLYMSERAATGYLQIYHLLIELMKYYPNLRSRLVSQVQEFVKYPEKRAKGPNGTKDLGEFLVKVAVMNGSATGTAQSSTFSCPALTSKFPTMANVATSNTPSNTTTSKSITRQQPTSDRHNATATSSYKLSLSSLQYPFILETFTRNIRWVLQTYPLTHYPPPHRNLRNTFSASKTSLRLVMFQIYFLRDIAGASGVTEELVSNYGFCKDERRVPEHIVDEVKKIREVDNYREFFERLGWEEGMKWCECIKPDWNSRRAKLREEFDTIEEVMEWCFQQSGKKGYHQLRNRGRSYMN